MQTCLAASALFSEENLDKQLIADSEWIYIEGYALSQENSFNAVLKAIEIAKENDTKIAITFSDVFITDIFRNQLEKCVSNADLIFCNENEAFSFTKTDNLNDAIKILSKFVASFVITLGAKGAIAFVEGKEYKISPYPVNLVDTTGAGDMFAAGFLYGLIVLKDIRNAGHIASAASAEIVSQLGARYKDNLKDIVKRLAD
jgi:fructokinase